MEGVPIPQTLVAQSFPVSARALEDPRINKRSPKTEPGLTARFNAPKIRLSGQATGGISGGKMPSREGAKISSGKGVMGCFPANLQGPDLS